MKVGILGGGQLGRMLALAGYPLGRSFRFLDPSADAPVCQLGELVVGGFDDPRSLDEFAEGVDVVTYEFENVPVSAVKRLETGTGGRAMVVRPSSSVLEVTQDRLREKELFRSLGIGTPRCAAVDTREQLDGAIASIGIPAVLKTRRMGYDGKGQYVLRGASDVDAAWKALGGTGASGDRRSGNEPTGAGLILEEFIRFGRELSVLVVRGPAGEEAVYPLVENSHSGGILRVSRAPAPNVSPQLQARAMEIAKRVVEALGYIGVLAIELFQHGDELLGNEMAPRVHNSGHWTIEGARTSQFENHIRAITGLPLGSTESVGYSIMLNLIGTTPATEAVLAVRGAHLHLYGKEPRPGRKLGHVTVWRDSAAQAEEAARAIKRLIPDG